jgi:protein tyrosine/serine phosphatase
MVAYVKIKQHIVFMNIDFIYTLRRILFLASIFAMSIAGFSNPALEKCDNSRIKNFGRINANYYRGGQPKARDFEALKELGIKTVINLRKDDLKQEETWAQNAGMNYLKIPLSTTRPATREQTEEFLKLVREPAHWPVYVHCAAGRHRTGAMTAIYRITFDSWTADMAYKEMKQYGYYSFPNHGSLKEFVYRYFQGVSGASKKNKSASPGFTGKPSFANAGAD